MWENNYRTGIFIDVICNSFMESKPRKMHYMYKDGDIAGEDGGEKIEADAKLIYDDILSWCRHVIPYRS